MSCHPPVKTEGRSVPWGRPGEYREYLQLNVGLSLLYLSPNFYYNIYYQQKKMSWEISIGIYFYKTLNTAIRRQKF